MAPSSVRNDVLKSLFDALSKYDAIHLLSIEIHTVVGVVAKPRLFHRAVDQTRVLRPLMAVHVCGHVPGILVAERTTLAQRHALLDEGQRRC